MEQVVLSGCLSSPAVVGGRQKYAAFLKHWYAGKALGIQIPSVQQGKMLGRHLLDGTNIGQYC